MGMNSSHVIGIVQPVALYIGGEEPDFNEDNNSNKASANKIKTLKILIQTAQHLTYSVMSSAHIAACLQLFCTRNKESGITEVSVLAIKVDFLYQFCSLCITNS